MNGNLIPPCRPHGLQTLDPGRHASSGAPGAPWRFAGVLRSSRSRSRPGGRSQRPVVAALLAALASLLLAAPAAAQSGVPGAPTGVTYTDGHQVVKLHWTAPANVGDSPITKYKIRFNTQFYETENTSYVVTGRTGQIDGFWHLEVRAVNANGEGPAAAVRVWVHSATVTIASGSDVLEGQGAEFTLTADRPVLSTSRPLNVSLLVSESETMVESTNEGAKTASFTLGATTAEHSVPTHPDTTGEEDSDVTVAIQANADYTVGMAASATVTVRDNDDPVPPTNVTITEGHHTVRVSWTAPADDGGSAITAYQVEAGGTTATTSSGSVTSHVLDSLADGAYTIRVRAVHASGNGAWSNSTNATVGPATVTIAGEGDPNAGEGAGSEYGWVEFTLTTDRPVLSASQPLDVSVLVSETEDMLPSGYEGAQTASFALNSATHVLELTPTTDTTQESDSVVTATIQTSTDYTVGTPSSATVTILDDDGPPERPVTGLTVTEGHYSFRAEWDAYVPRPGEPPEVRHEIQFGDFEPSIVPRDTHYEYTDSIPSNFEFHVRATNSTHTDRHGPWSDSVPVRVGGATVTIAGNGPVSEGDDAVFTLTSDRENRSGVNGLSALIVDVLVSETDDMVASANEEVHTVTFPWGDDAARTVTLTVPTVDDDKDERDSVVTPTIQTAPSTQVRPYTVGSPASATVKVANDDFGKFERLRLDSCGVSAPHSSGHAIECFQLVGSSYVRTPEGMAERGYAPVGNPREVGDIVAMEGVPDDWVISVLGVKLVDDAVVTIAAGTSPVPEGTDVMFTLTRATAAATHLSVTVGVAETQSMIFNGVPGSTGIVTWPNRVDILANASAATFVVYTDDDDVVETDSVITATVNAGNGYTAGTSGSASVTVEDNDGGTGQQQAGTPGAPRDFSARPAGESRIDLSWTAPAGEPTGYEVEWSADGETGWTAVDPAHAGTAAEYADEGLDGGTTRYYRVRALNEAGEGEWSAVANATTNLHLVLEGPDAPENLSASASGTSGIDLSWTAPEGEPTGYAVEWSGDGETGWAAVDPEHSGTATEYAHTGLTANTAYYYRVLALADAVPGKWSDVASATTDSATRQRGEPPAAPGNVSAGASGESRIEVSWSAPKGEVTGYEVEWSADGSGSWTAADPAHSGTATGYSDTGLDAGTTRHYRVRAVNGAGSGEWSGPASATTERPELTARFEQAPAEHEGPDSTFSLRMVFSEPVTAGYRNLRDEAIRATNGAVRQASRVNGSSAEWEVTVAPSSREAVTVSISGGSDACRQGDAVCTEDGRRLSNSPSVTVEGPPAVPLTAELEGVPEEHDGESTFTFGLTFSEEPRVSYRTLRDSAFDVDGGAVRNAGRRQSGSDQSWEITVQPSSHRDVSIRLPETGSCSASGAICTADGRPLSHALSASVRGPAAISVSDARVEEAAGAAVAFAVTLSRAASDRVTVGLPDAGRQRAGRRGLRGGERHADILRGHLVEDHRGRRAGRCARRGRGDVHPGAVERVGSVAGGRRGDRDDRECGPDAGGAAGAVRAGDGRAGGRARRAADGGASGAGLPGAVRRPGAAAGHGTGLRARLPVAVRAADGNGSRGLGSDGGPPRWVRPRGARTRWPRTCPAAARARRA